MNAATESRLLRLAISKGLLSWGDLDELAAGLPEDALPEDEAAQRLSWIDLLLAAGRLDEATVAALLAEINESGPETKEPTYGPQQPFPYPPELRFLGDWPRYRLERQLGAGGMGTVFLAFDPSLGRRVALKFLHRNDPQQTERFLREARSQARVEHPNICKVHEVGEVDGRPYIAMQYIEGSSLSELRAALSIEEGVRLVSEVARAVQAAHRSGLIHRDLKPANILVALDEAGRREPYVVDFGLAQDQSEESLTRTGMISGTPAYLSPEQAQGNPLDRRTDVYSLGIVLYEMLAGEPPFVGASPAGTLLRVIQEDPPRLRKIAPAVSQDLETIVMKCIEKDPDRRYDSARALADDLDRWLDGEPIQARPAGFSYRLGKKLRKNRGLAIVAAAAAVVLLVLAGGLMRVRMQARERTELAQRFGQRVSNVEAGLRYAAVLPRHDMTESKRRLRRELQQIEDEMKRLGPLAAGPGSYALGRGYLALHQVETARQHLERAWQAGEHGPEVAAALGRTFGFLYEKALVDATQPNGRQTIREDAERSYRRPALSYLQEASRDAQSDPYLAGLLAFYEGRYGEAVSRAREAYRQIPWFYEAAQLEADVYRLQGDEAFDQGRREEALLFYDRSGEVYRRLLAAVPSDAFLYASDCDRQSRRIRVARTLGNADNLAAQEATEEEALATCGRALEVDPELADALVSQAAIYWERADGQKKRGIDPRPALVQAIRLSEKAIALAPRDATARKNLAVALRLQGSWELEHGGDPRPSLGRAVAAAEKAVELQPELATNHNILGVCWLVSASDRQRRGGDPAPALRASIASFERALAVNPRFQSSLINLGNAWNVMVEAQAARGADPAEATGKAVAAFERAAALSPSSSIHNNLGNSFLTYGEYLLARGIDPRPTLEKAAAHYAKSVELKPDYAYGPYNQAYTQRLLAQALRDRGLDPSPALRAADAFVDASFRLNPDDSDTWLERGRIRLIEARWAADRKQDPGPALDLADQALRRAEAVNPGAPPIYIAEAQAHRRRAERALAQGGDPAAALRGGLGCLAKALAIHPDEPEALALRGTLAALGGRDFTQAAADLEKALALNPLLQREYGTILDQARKQLAPRL